MQLRPIFATVLVALVFSLACTTARAGKLDDDLRKLMPGPEYSIILESKYRRFFTESPVNGFVKMLGAVSGNGIVIREVLTAAPATVDTKTAKVLADRVRLNASSSGSRVSPSIDVYVAFYNQDKPDKVALVFAAPTNGSSNIQAKGDKTYFLEIVEYHTGNRATDASKPAPAATSAPRK